MNWSDEDVCLCFLAFVCLMRLKMAKDLRGGIFFYNWQDVGKGCLLFIQSVSVTLQICK